MLNLKPGFDAIPIQSYDSFMYRLLQMIFFFVMAMKAFMTQSINLYVTTKHASMQHILDSQHQSWLHWLAINP